MKKKIEIITHGNTWIDTSTPIVCPECTGLNVQENIYNSIEWHGLFRISYSRKIYSCKDCNCRFKIGKDKTSICGCSWDDLFGIINLFSFILLIILIIYSAISWDSVDLFPLSMKIAIIADTIITITSFLAWLAAMQV